MTCSCRLLCGVRLGRAHFSYNDIVGVESESHVEKIILRDGFSLVLRLSGDGVDDLVAYLSVFVTLHKVKLSGAVLNGEDSLIKGNGA